VMRDLEELREAHWFHSVGYNGYYPFTVLTTC
jgi:hypothetical protein